ncbi:MAG: gamma-glutamylcyclotransferase [Planctomycetes bacterium]|nr:gamma-glutamylcyclotransferase [Planctomycetota bacterium]
MKPAKFFVYGTLQCGEPRAKFWPRSPLRVEPAFVLATMHDLGPYPAIVEGADRVRGELWTIAAEDVEATLAALDAVEGYNQGGADWYIRRLVPCHTFDGARHEAYAYFWADPSGIADTPLIPADPEGYRDWKRRNLQLPT